LEEECPIKPVPDQASRYAETILFLLEDQIPEQFKLNGREDQKSKAKVLKKYQNWKTKVRYRYYVDDAGTEHSESHLRQLNSRGEWSQVPFIREIRSLCERVHDANHLAFKPMINKLKEFKLLWHNMSADVTRSITNCTRCTGRRRSSDRIVKTNHTIPCKRPFERFQADLQTLKEEHGAVPPYKYLLVIIDYFSRFAWVVPIARKLASLVSDEFNSLLSELPHQPSIVQTGNGGEFRSSFDKLLLAEGIKHITSKPRKPQTNGAVERLNKTISDKLTERSINKTSGVRWNFTLDLQQIVSSYNATVHSTTGRKPEDLIAETDADVLKLVGQHIKRQRHIQEDAGDANNEEGNPNVSLDLSDFVAIRNDIVTGARYWIKPKQNKFRPDRGVTYNIPTVVRMTYSTHAQLVIFPPHCMRFNSITINVSYDCLMIITAEQFASLCNMQPS
jgi:transposase InsO family protein